MSARAGVSEGSFFEIFLNVGECYRAAYEQGLERLACAVGDAAGREQGWLGRVRAGLVALLGFFDDEPAWARLLVLEAPPVDVALALACRRRLCGLFVEFLEGGDREGDRARDRGSPGALPELTGELVAGGVFSVIAANMLAETGGRLVELAPSLLAFVVASCAGLEAVARIGPEGWRPPEHRSSVGRRVSAGAAGAARGDRRAQAISRAGELPIRVTRRTTLVLGAIARAPYSNNREVARAAGMVDEGQASKLLARLERHRLVENVGVGAARGEPNAWSLTASGQRALQLLGESFADGKKTTNRCS